MKCHACGQDNAERALFCTQCRRPLVAPTKTPVRLEPLAVAPSPAMAAMAAPMGGAVGSGPHARGRDRDRYAPPNAAAGDRDGDESSLLSDEEAWGAVIGDSNTAYYLTRFERLAHGESAAWHWPALFITWYWLLYRKMWVGALIYFFVPGIVLGAVSAALPTAALPLTLAWWLALFIVPAVMANGWYYRSCMKRIRDVRARGGSKEQMVARLESAGGTSNIVVILVAVFAFVAGIGILAAVALPAYQTYTVKAKVGDAVLAGAQVATAVGRQYEQTGTLPSGAEVDRMVAEAPRQSKYVRGVEFDGSTGVLTLKVQATPSIEGSVVLMPSADSKRHLSWSCMSEDLKRYLPSACRTQGGLVR